MKNDIITIDGRTFDSNLFELSMIGASPYLGVCYANDVSRYKAFINLTDDEKDLVGSKFTGEGALTLSTYDCPLSAAFTVQQFNLDRENNLLDLCIVGLWNWTTDKPMPKFEYPALGKQEKVQRNNKKTKINKLETIAKILPDISNPAADRFLRQFDITGKDAYLIILKHYNIKGVDVGRDLLTQCKAFKDETRPAPDMLNLMASILSDML